jgi:hypothetical protein
LERWRTVRIFLRADSGFARDPLMTWCETSAVDFIFGQANNMRLNRAIGTELTLAQEEALAAGQPAPFQGTDLDHTQELEPQAARHRQGRVDHGEVNPRFIVTSLIEGNSRDLYKGTYCARGRNEEPYQ